MVLMRMVKVQEVLVLWEEGRGGDRAGLQGEARLVKTKEPGGTGTWVWRI